MRLKWKKFLIITTLRIQGGSKIKRRIVTLCISLTFALGISIPVNATALTDTAFTGELVSLIPPLEKETTNEYDYIVGIREAAKNAKTIANVSEEEVEYITSDAIESELLYRATLPAEVL